MAQGPLQTGATAFNLVVRSVGRLRPNRRREQLPTHVTQSSRTGQLAFFDRAVLATEHFSQWEVWWPAAASLHEPPAADEPSDFISRNASRAR